MAYRDDTLLDDTLLDDASSASSGPFIANVKTVKCVLVVSECAL